MAPSKKTSPKILNKRKNIGSKQSKSDISFKVQQPALQESFKALEKRLRPRTRKNYCEISRRSQQFSDKTDTDDVERKPDKGDILPKSDKVGKALPIYKTVKLLPDSPKKDNKEVYDFDASSDDTEPKNKKKKRIIKKPATKRVRKNNRIPNTIFKKKAEVLKAPVVVLTKTDVSKLPIKKPAVVDNVPTRQKIEQKAPNGKKHVEFQLDMCDMEIPIPNPQVNTLTSPCNAPKITKIENLQGPRRISLTTPPVSKDAAMELRTFRATNVFTSKPSIQYHNMMNHSLLNKSFSPIQKVNMNFDVGSPWRPQVTQSFSQVKQLVHSTPQVQIPFNRDKRLNMKKRIGLMLANKINQVANKINQIPIQSEKTITIDSTIEPEGSKSISSPAKSPRQFGVEISNTSCAKSMKSTPNVQFTQRIGQQAASIITETTKLPLQTLTGNEENKPPNLQSPLKSQKKAKFSALSPFRLERSRTNKKPVKSTIIQEKENNEPQPGPSWLENSCHQSSNLKQSNLNEFLNLDDMPQSTVITTNHGIFNDMHSTPIVCKKQVKSQEAKIGIENAFGFDDDCLSEEESPMNRIPLRNQRNIKKKESLSNPSRLSARTIKRKLIKNVLKSNNVPKSKDIVTPSCPDIAEENVENHKIAKNCKKSERESFVDPAKFADTFDVLSESGKLVPSIPSELPLFADLEPAHFSQPPRHSYNNPIIYKRKRPIRCNITEPEYGESASEEEQEVGKKIKKRRVNTKENKKMQEWVKNINATFEEIDHHELVVE